MSEEAAETPPLTPEDSMEIHKPKPWHGFREFLKEYLIIVLGVLTALGLEQFVDSLHWDHKIDQAERAMRIELGRDRTDASQYAILAACTDTYLNRVSDDLLRNDHADLARLYQLGEPFVTEPWTATAWEAAVASQIGDHMATDRFVNYAEAFRRADLMKDVQFRLRDHFVTAMVGRFDLTGGQGQAEQITAADDLRRDITLARVITSDFVANTDELNIVPDPKGVVAYQQKAELCIKKLRAHGGDAE